MVSYLEYLEKMMRPKGLSVLYPHPGNTLSIWNGWVCAVVLACLTYSVIRVMRQAPYLAVKWFGYLGTLIPVIGIVQVGIQAMADRYMYVPLVGIFIAIGWGVPELLKKLPYRNLLLSVASGLLIPTLMVLTWQQVSHWKDSITLFKHAIEVYDKMQTPPPFALTYNNLGVALHAKNNLEQAKVSYKPALEIKPDYADAHFNLGTALSVIGKLEEAAHHFKKAKDIEGS